MNVIKTTNTDTFAIEAVNFFTHFLSNNAPSIITLPTGNTPLPFYKNLVKEYKKNKNLNNFKYLSLDEYYGLEKNDHRLFANWLDREVLTPLEIPVSRRITINSSCHDVEEHCTNIENRIRENNGIDLAIIGIGSNGHIGFNEPGSNLESLTHKVDLTPETITANAQYWGSEEDVPKSAITLGIGTLKKAKHTLLLVTGKNKAQIIRSTFQEDISNKIPSTYLQQQQNLTIIGDEEALSLL